MLRLKKQRRTKVLAEETKAAKLDAASLALNQASRMNLFAWNRHAPRPSRAGPCSEQGRFGQSAATKQAWVRGTQVVSSAVAAGSRRIDPALSSYSHNGGDDPRCQRSGDALR